MFLLVPSGRAWTFLCRLETFSGTLITNKIQNGAWEDLAPEFSFADTTSRLGGGCATLFYVRLLAKKNGG